MSFCRFSDDNWKSDIYAYEAKDGYVIHVASNRHVGDIPAIDWSGDPTSLHLSRQAQIKALDRCDIVAIGGAYDGKTFVFRTPQEVIKCVLMLIDEGYHVPHWVIPEMKREIEGA